MWYTLGKNCKGTIYNIFYGTCFTKKSCTALEKWKINFLFVVLLVYHFSHKPLHIGGLHAKEFQFLSLFIIFYKFFQCVVKIACKIIQIHFLICVWHRVSNEIHTNDESFKVHPNNLKYNPVLSYEFVHTLFK